MHNRSEPPLPRRVGTHREHRRGDWRRRVGPGRRDGLVSLGSDVRNRRRLAAASVSVAAVLVVAGTHVLLTQIGADPPADLETAGQNPVPRWNVPQPGELVPTGGPASTPAQPRGGPATPPVSTSPIHPLSRPGSSTHAVPPPRAAHPTRTASPKPPPVTSAPPRAKTPTEKPTSTAPRPTTPPAPPVTTGTGSLTGIGGQCLDAASQSTGSAESSGSAESEAESEAESTDGATVRIFDCNGSSTQTWTLQGGTLQALGQCLEASGDGAGRPLELHGCDGGAAQHWQLSSGAIVSPSSELCLGVADDSTSVVTVACAAGPAQTWTLS